MTNIGFLSLDILILIALFIILFVISFKFGKKIITSLILSIYPALLIFNSAPINKWFKEDTAKSIMFIVLYLILTTVLWKNIHVRKLNSKTRKIVDYSLLSISYILLLTSVYLNSVNFIKPFYNFSGTIIDLISNIPFGVLLALPLVIILITNRKDL